MSKIPLISVITVCLNSGLTIARAFDSVLGQCYPNLEYLVVDGGSSDNTLDIIKKYDSAFKAHNILFHWVSGKDKGIYDAMNKGISKANGEMIGILNSDDFYEPNALLNVSQAYASSPKAGILYGFLRQFKAGNELVIHRYNYDYILSDLASGVYSAAQHPACFVKRSVYEQIGAYDISFSIGADYDFLLRAKSRGVKFAPIDAVITNFSLDGASSKICMADRLEQRYRAQFKNGLLRDAEYRRKQNLVKYQKYKAFKQRVIKWIFQTENTE